LLWHLLFYLLFRKNTRECGESTLQSDRKVTEQDFILFGGI
jgi:hypothetical protein